MKQMRLEGRRKVKYKGRLTVSDSEGDVEETEAWTPIKHLADKKQYSCKFRFKKNKKYKK